MEDTLASFKGNPLAYYYFDITDREKQTVSNLLRSLLGQLCNQMAAIPETVSMLYNTHKSGNSIPQHALTSALLSILSGVKQACVFIDALDECREIKELLQHIKKLHTSSQGRLQIFVTSQKLQSVASAFQDIVTGTISVEGDKVARDIGLLVGQSLTEGGKLSEWASHPLKVDIEEKLCNGAHGSYVASTFFCGPLKNLSLR